MGCGSGKGRGRRRGAGASSRRTGTTAARTPTARPSTAPACSTRSPSTASCGGMRRAIADRPTWAAVRGGRNPYSVAVHPSGDRVAVSYQDNPNVEVYDARTLSWLHSADTRGVDNGNLFAVAWSPDGTRLLAGGVFNRGGPFVIRVWDRIGQGPAREIEGPTNTILHMLPCGSNIAFGSADPAFSLIDARRTAPGVAGGRAGRPAQPLRGRPVTLAGRPQGPLPARRARQEPRAVRACGRAAERRDQARQAPSTARTRRSLPVVDWFDNPAPRVGGTPLQLEQHEWSRSLAIAPGGQTLVIGAEWSLRGFDRSGRQLWLKQAPATVWSVNIPRDGKVVVAGYGDGTVRWHRLSDGEELLALFVHAKDRRWVAWTPKGYYMASPGAESLIGWHLNRGWDETAQFFSVDRFREQFNRPDIVKGVLETLDESRTIEAANSRAKVKRAVEDVRAIAPPIVLIQKPGDNSTFRSAEVTLEYFAFSPTGKRITDVDVRVNNASLGARAAVPINPLGNEPIKLTLTLPPEDVTITLVAREERQGECAGGRAAALGWRQGRSGELAPPARAVRRRQRLQVGQSHETRLRGQGRQRPRHVLQGAGGQDLQQGRVEAAARRHAHRRAGRPGVDGEGLGGRRCESLVPRRTRHHRRAAAVLLPGLRQRPRQGARHRRLPRRDPAHHPQPQGLDGGDARHLPLGRHGARAAPAAST